MKRHTGQRGSRHARTVLLAAAAAVGVLALNPTGGRAATLPSFAATYVDKSLAGGEPFVIYSHAGHDLIYSSHEGTTHVDKNQITNPFNVCDLNGQGFVCSYQNKVNVWDSHDGGVSWNLSTNLPVDSGFSDPSLTEDKGSSTQPPYVYDTGIDLANDALFASNDGGNSWLAGTPQCHEGDRPWLAGANPGEVFMATDSTGHVIYHGEVTTVAGQGLAIVCNQNGITDPDGGGDGQIYYNQNTGDLVEGALFNDGAFGIGVLKHASADFGGPTGSPTATPTGSFQDIEPHYGAQTICQAYPGSCGTVAALVPEVAIDANNTIYVTWDTDPTSQSSNNGCTGATTAGPPGILPNRVLMVYTTDEGQTWSPPLTIADPTTSGGNTVLWPWITAGAAGNVNVVWYQSKQLTDPDCDSASLQPGGHPTPWTLQSATILDATNPATTYPPPSVNVLANFNDGNHPGGVIHVGGICESGTGCVASGQDRRLGDYFTNALDQNGCVMIATGDTQLTDPITHMEFATSRPLFIKQTSGPSLTSGLDCAGTLAVATPETPVVAGLALVGATVFGAVLAFRRRRSRRATE